jgi:glycosyltransferase involved in cell wall biosynthesis
VIPVYNRADTIRPTLESVRLQTFPDFECIVVDDGSVDGKQLTETINNLNDARFRYVRQDSKGANAARNRGIDLSRGLYVAMLDSDDLLLPHHLVDHHAALVENATGAVFSQVIVDRGDGISFIKPPRGMRAGEAMGDYLLRDRGFIQTSTLALPTSLARQIRYAEGLPFGQDTDFAIRASHAGVAFTMLERPSAVWSDRFDPKRVSSGRSANAREAWLVSVSNMISDKAAKADRGWYVAKCHAHDGKLRRALPLYLSALLSGCYPPALAARIALQVFLSGRLYRLVADSYLALRGR